MAFKIFMKEFVIIVDKLEKYTCTHKFRLFSVFEVTISQEILINKTFRGINKYTDFVYFPI